MTPTGTSHRRQSGLPSLSRADKTAFFSAVWDHVRRVPSGRVVSYGQIARALGELDGVDPLVFKREGAQWVGSALAACPDDVPWHRVVSAQGRISYQGAAAQQQQLLAQEGVRVENGHLDMSAHVWPDSGADMSPQQSLF